MAGDVRASYAARTQAEGASAGLVGGWCMRNVHIAYFPQLVDTNKALTGAAAEGARVVILDMTGVPAITRDSAMRPGSKLMARPRVPTSDA